jgi:spore germination protein
MIRRIIHFVVMAALVVGVVGTGYWGYQEHQDKNSILIKAENSYQRAFHNLNNNISNLEDELGKSIAMNTRNLLAPCMANIWRLASHARSNVGQLPLMLVPFSETEAFLGKISDFTFDIGMRDLENEPLSDKEWEQLKSLHGQAKHIQGELRKIQTKVLDDQLRWMDVELAIASENKNMDKSIIDGITAIDKQVQGYVETEWGATSNKLGDHSGDLKKKIKGKKINSDQAKKKAGEFLKLDKQANIKLDENGEGLEYDSYSIHIQRQAESEDRISVEVSVKGGHVLWMLDSRDIESTKIGLNEAQNKAIKFLEDRGITSMEVVESNQYDNVGVFDFVFQKNNVRIYTDLVTVKVALDNGDIIGYEALDYVVSHDEKKEIPTPKISLEEAKSKLNKNYKVMEDHLSMVEIKAGEVKLCYELLGTIGDETYRIFVNTETGVEEKIEKLKQAESIV